MADYFPPIEPTHKGYLKVSELHEIYYEESGNPEGKAILFLHGGPGSGTQPYHRQYFDPDFYRIVLFDQRGCGLSRPHGELRENTSRDLVEDIEKLRRHLSIDSWIVFGGSWGSTLALLYALHAPERVNALILRGIFLCTQDEIDWFIGGGAARFFPENWEKFLSVLPKDTAPQEIVRSYYALFNSEDEATRNAACLAWAGWEGSLLCLDPALPGPRAEDAENEADALYKAIAISKIECHYFLNNELDKAGSIILKQQAKIADIPCFIVNGRYDMICPPETAWKLARGFRNCELQIAPLAGHSSGEEEIAEALLSAVERYKRYAR